MVSNNFNNIDLYFTDLKHKSWHRDQDHHEFIEICSHVSLRYFYSDSVDSQFFIENERIDEAENGIIITLFDEISLAEENISFSSKKVFLVIYLFVDDLFLGNAFGVPQNLIIEYLKSTLTENPQAINKLNMIGKANIQEFNKLITSNNLLLNISQSMLITKLLFDVFDKLKDYVFPITDEKTKDEDYARIKELEFYIKANIHMQSLSIDELAEKANMSSTKFKLLFKRYFNETAHQYILGLRAAHAKKLLETRQYNISQVAYKVGFNHPSGLTRLFKSKFNKSPVDFLN